MDGNSALFSLPWSGTWHVAVWIADLDVGEWDWLVMADYNGNTPVNPFDPWVDTFGGPKKRKRNLYFLSHEIFDHLEIASTIS